MTTPDDPRDPRLGELLADAVSDVEPAHRLDEIRDRTKVTAMSARRPWLLAAGGAVAATAAVVVAIAAVGGSPFDRASDPVPAGPPSASPSDSPTTTEDPGEPTQTGEGTPDPTTVGGNAVPVYLVSEQPQGLRLFREFHASQSEAVLLVALQASVEGDNLDPDYRSLWPVGSSVATAAFEGDTLVVDVTGAPRELPPGMSEDDAALAIQQVVYTAQAAHGAGRVPVQLLLDGGRSDMVLGQPTSEPLAEADLMETLSLMQVSYPNEGDAVTGSFTANGVNNGFEGTVAYRIYDGETVVGEGAGIADGAMEEKLFPWSVEVDMSGLEPGAYTIVFSNDDPSGGAEGAGPQTDSRTIFLD